MATISSFDELAAFFAESGLVHESKAAQSTIQLPIRQDTLDGVLFIRWEPEQQVAHFVQSLNIALTEDRLEAVALAMALINHLLPFPGFGINVAQGYGYYRFSLPFRPEGSLTQQEVQGVFNLCVQMASAHRPALAAVAEQGAAPTSVLPAAG